METFGNDDRGSILNSDADVVTIMFWPGTGCTKLIKYDDKKYDGG